MVEAMVHDCFGSFGWVDDHLARCLAVEQVLTQPERLCAGELGNSGVSADRMQSGSLICRD